MVYDSVTAQKMYNTVFFGGMLWEFPWDPARSRGCTMGCRRILSRGIPRHAAELHILGPVGYRRTMPDVR